VKKEIGKICRKGKHWISLTFLLVFIGKIIVFPGESKRRVREIFDFIPLPPFCRDLSGKRPGTPWENIGIPRRTPGELPDKSF